jgi:outer membrane protein assembly factor BamD
MVAECLRLLARHELYVADFYMNRDQYRAAIIRLRRLLSDFDGSGMEPEALILLGRTYLRMEEIRDARDTFNELLERFPDSGYAEQARSYLHEMGEEVPERPERSRPETAAGAEESEESEASEG